MNYTVGKFRAKALDGELGYSTNGNEQVAVRFELLEGPDSGKFITWWGYFSEKTADRTLKALLDAGWDGGDVSVLSGLGSSEVRLTIDNDTYQGVTTQRVQWVNPLTGPKTKNSMGDGDKASFAEKMRGRTMKLQEQVPAQAGHAETPDDDEIPF